MDKRKITRRDFLKKTALTGAGLALSSSLLRQKLFAGTKEKKVEEKAAEETGWNIPRFEGQPINLVCVGGELDDTPIRDWKSKFGQETGIDLTVHDIGFMPYHDKLVQILRSGTYAYDVTAITPLWVQDAITPGYLEDLGKLMKNERITFPETVEGIKSDFFEAFIENYAGWYNPHTQIPGHVEDSILYLLPGTHSGGTILAYRQDIFDKHGIKSPPTTWPEHNDLCKEFNRPGEDFYGTTITGKADGNLSLVDWYVRFSSQGGKVIKGNLAEKNATANVYNDMGIKALQWLKDIVPYCPPGVFSYGGAESSEPMQSGKAAMQVQITTFAGRFWVPELSKIANVVKGAEIPGVGKYKGVGFGGGWAWGIPTTAKNKEAAWVTAQYFSTKAFDKYRCIKYGLMPVRKSTVRDSEVQKVQPWAAYVEPIINKAVVPEYFYFPEAFEILDLFNRELNAGLTGTVSVEQAMKNISDQMNAIFKRDGYQANL